MKSVRCRRCRAHFASERGLAGHSRHCKSVKSIADIKVTEADSTCYDIQCNNDTTCYDNESTGSNSTVCDRLPCTSKYLEVQNIIAQAMAAIKLNSQKYEKIDGLLLIHVFIEHNKLSANDTIDLFKILVTFNPQWCVQDLQSKYHSVTSKTDALRNKIFQIEAYSYSIPRYFTDGNHDIYEGHHLNILSVVADMMLSIDEGDLIADSNEDHMVFAEPTKGLICRKMKRYIHDTYGKDYYPLPIVVSLDGLILNKIGTRNAKPVYIQLACIKSKSYMSSNNVRCVGFAPQLQVVLILHIFFVTLYVLFMYSLKY